MNQRRRFHHRVHRVRWIESCRLCEDRNCHRKIPLLHEQEAERLIRALIVWIYLACQIELCDRVIELLSLNKEVAELEVSLKVIGEDLDRLPHVLDGVFDLSFTGEFEAEGERLLRGFRNVL